MRIRSIARPKGPRWARILNKLNPQTEDAARAMRTVQAPVRHDPPSRRSADVWRRLALEPICQSRRQVPVRDILLPSGSQHPCQTS